MDTPTSDPAYVPILGMTGNLSSLETHMLNSHGMPVMKDEDVKLSMIHLQLALERQMLINENLVKRIARLEKKRSKRGIHKK